MKSKLSRKELNECKYVDLKLRSRDPTIRQITDYYVDQVSRLAPKRTRVSTMRGAEKAIKGIVADLFRARDAGNAVVALSLREGNYSKNRGGSISYQSLRLALSVLDSPQVVDDVEVDPLIFKFIGYRSESGFKDNTKLKLNETAVDFWLDKINQTKEQSIECQKPIDAAVRFQLIIDSTFVSKKCQPNENDLCHKGVRCKYQYKDYVSLDKSTIHDTRTGKEGDLESILSDIKEEITPITSRLKYRFYSSEPRSAISLRNNDGIAVRFERTPCTDRMEEGVNRYNEFLQRKCVQLFLPDTELEDMLQATRSKLRERRQGRDFARTRSQIVGDEALGLYRVFNRGSFECGGRHYGGFWQNIPRSYRPFITIDGHPTVELDFKALHPTIIYHLEKLRVDRDPYDLDDFPKGHRDTVKSAFMTLLNAKPDSRRLTSLEALSYPPGWNPKSLSEAIEQRHGPIKHAFRSDMGVKLQRLDSDIAAIVLQTMREDHHALALPVHDSFIVTEDQEANLRALMIEAYEHVIGTGEIQIDRKLTLFESLNDVREQSEPARLIRYAEGMMDTCGNLIDYKNILSRLPIATQYRNYLLSLTAHSLQFDKELRFACYP